MKEYFMELSAVPEDMEEWFLLQGARVTESKFKDESPSRRSSFKDSYFYKDYEVIFNHRKIHFYAGSTVARVFFTEDTVNTAFFLLIKWPELIIRHNIPRAPT